MNIYIRYFLFFAIASIISFTSCDESEEPEIVSISGEWTTISRRVTTGDEFIDKSINSLFILDDSTYTVTRTFTQTSYDKGSLETIATNKKTGSDDRKRDATYQMVDDTLRFNDKKFEQYNSEFILSEKVLITYTSVGKKELDHIVEEIGGDPNLIPDNIKGILRMEERK